jgi:hypothetical protein
MLDKADLHGMRGGSILCGDAHMQAGLVIGSCMLANMMSAHALHNSCVRACLASGGGHPQEGVVRQVRPEAAQHCDPRPG